MNKRRIGFFSGRDNLFGNSYYFLFRFRMQCATTEHPLTMTAVTNINSKQLFEKLLTLVGANNRVGTLTFIH